MDGASGADRGMQEHQALLASPRASATNGEHAQGLRGLNEHLIEERLIEVEQISVDVSRINETYVNLGLLVEGQGELLKRQNQSIETAAENTRQTVQQLDQANECRKKRSWAYFKCLVLLIVALIVLYVAI